MTDREFRAAWWWQVQVAKTLMQIRLWLCEQEGCAPAFDRDEREDA